MTDEALSAAAEPVSAPEPSTPVETPAVAEPTARGAIDRAFEAVEKMEQGEPEAKKPDEPQGDERPRGPDGKFIAKEGDKPEEKAADKPEAGKEPPKAETPFSEPPSRFSADAKAAWNALPDAVKAETHRAIRELEQGIEKYRAPAAAFEELREFDELARQTGTTMKAAMANYVGIEKLLMADPLKGLNQIAENMGFSLKDIAAHVMGQTPDQTQSQNDATIRALRQEIAGLKQELGGVTSTIQEQRQTATMQQVEAFAKDHPRFEELAEDIKFFIESGRTKDLSEAYSLAERLNPAPQAPAPAAPAAQPDLTAQTRKGSLSVTGAPSSGSNPANRKPPSSPREALDRAFANVGM